MSDNYSSGAPRLTECPSRQISPKIGDLARCRGVLALKEIVEDSVGRSPQKHVQSSTRVAQASQSNKKRLGHRPKAPGRGLKSGNDDDVSFFGIRPLADPQHASNISRFKSALARAPSPTCQVRISWWPQFFVGKNCAAPARMISKMVLRVRAVRTVC